MVSHGMGCWDRQEEGLSVYELWLVLKEGSRQP